MPNLSGKKVPFDATLLDRSRYGDADFAFTHVHKTVSVTIEHTLTAAGGHSKKHHYSQKVLTRELTLMNGIFDTVDKRLHDSTLSQVPAPTVRGNSNRLGQTTILEPCAPAPSTIGYFKVGPYVGTVSLNLNKSDSTFGHVQDLPVEDATITKLVDEVAQNIIAKKGAVKPLKH